MQGLTGETRSGSSSYAPAHRPKSAETTNDEPFRDYVQSFVIVRRTQVVFVNRSADSATEVRARLLVTSKMDAAVDARVGDVVGYLLERGVLQDDFGYRGVRQRNRMAGFAVKTPQNLGCSIACSAVV